MKEEIIKIINGTRNCSLKDICKKLKGRNKDSIEKLLAELEEDATIYKTQMNRYILFPKNYIITELFSTNKGIIFALDDRNKRIDIELNNLNGALAYDNVILEIKDNKGIVRKIVSRKTNHIVCEMVNNKLIPFNTNSNLRLLIDKEYLDKLVDGDRVLIEVVGNIDDEIFKGKPIKKIAHKDDPDADMISIAYSKGFEVDFSPESLKETEHMPTKVLKSEYKNRLDLRDELIFTIDGENTKDIDDAISLKLLPNGNYLLGVHIADVAHYIKEGFALFDDAKSRSTSLYLGNSVIPMLPHKLSNGICSLNPNVDRLTKSVFIEIDQYGNNVSSDYTVYPSIIKSKKKMSYEKVNKIFNDNIIEDDYKDYVDNLTLMHKFSLLINDIKKDRGFLKFQNNEIETMVDENNNPTEFKKRICSDAEELIENCMILANEHIATKLFFDRLPFIYRIHGIPNDLKLDKVITIINDVGHNIKRMGDLTDQRTIQCILNQLKNYPVLAELILRAMKRAEYSTKNIGHYGLALSSYTHFTSPIRRFADLQIHTLIDIYDKLYTDFDNPNQKLKEIESYLEDLCKHISYKERQADSAEYSYDKLEMAKYMMAHIGELFEAIIMDISENGIKIRTDNLIEGLVIPNENYRYDDVKKRYIGKNHTKYKIGNKVLVTSKEVKLETQDILFSIDKILEEDKIKKLVN